MRTAVHAARATGEDKNNTIKHVKDSIAPGLETAHAAAFAQLAISPGRRPGVADRFQMGDGRGRDQLATSEPRF